MEYQHIQFKHIPALLRCSFQLFKRQWVGWVLLTLINSGLFWVLEQTNSITKSMFLLYAVTYVVFAFCAKWDRRSHTSIGATIRRLSFGLIADVIILVCVCFITLYMFTHIVFKTAFLTSAVLTVVMVAIGGGLERDYLALKGYNRPPTPLLPLQWFIINILAAIIYFCFLTVAQTASWDWATHAFLLTPYVAFYYYAYKFMYDGKLECDAAQHTLSTVNVTQTSH